MHAARESDTPNQTYSELRKGNGTRKHWEWICQQVATSTAPGAVHMSRPLSELEWKELERELRHCKKIIMEYQHFKDRFHRIEAVLNQHRAQFGRRKLSVVSIED